MPTVEVTSPSGEVFEINAPEGASDEQILAYAKQHLAKGKDVASPASRFAYGAFEPVSGIAQILYNNMHPKVQQLGTDVDQWLYEKTDGVLGKAEPFNEALISQEQDYQETAPEGFDAARLVGNLATGILATRGIGAPTSAVQSMGQGAAVGGLLAGTAPIYSGDLSEKDDQLLIGGGAGLALGPVGYGIGRMISPKATASADIQSLKDAGVNPTIGATLGGSVGRAEEMAQSVPFFGDAIRSARVGARDEFNLATLNKVVSPSGKTVSEIGSDGIRQVQKISDDLYKQAREVIPGFRLDDVAKSEISALRKAARDLKPDESRRFANFMRNTFDARFRQGGITSTGFKTLDSELGKAYNANRSNELGGAFKELNEIIKRQAERASPEYKAALDKADKVFAQRVIVEKAANSASGTSGVFTPKQLVSAAKTTDQTVRKNQAAAGRRPLQEFGQQASRTIGDNYPDSGTAGRNFLTGLAGGSLLDPITAGLLVGGAWTGGKMLYSPMAQNILRQTATLRPKGSESVANEVSKALPFLAPAFLQ